jgi:integral membrane protein (TIGR01906 family)
MIICAIVLLLLLKEKWRMLIKGFFLGSILTLGIMTVLVLWAVFAFDQLFLVFHLLSFSNDFWILDPTKDFLIMLFPGQFFFDVAIFGFGAVIIESLIIGTAAFITLKLKT